MSRAKGVRNYSFALSSERTAPSRTKIVSWSVAGKIKETNYFPCFFAPSGRRDTVNLRTIQVKCHGCLRVPKTKAKAKTKMAAKIGKALAPVKVRVPRGGRPIAELNLGSFSSALGWPSILFTIGITSPSRHTRREDPPPADSQANPINCLRKTVISQTLARRSSDRRSTGHKPNLEI